MDDKFDKDLTKRIKEVFEDYSYPPADEGWAQMRKKFPAEEKKDKIAWLWWGSAAALLLVFLGVGLWLRVPEKTTQNIANNIVKPTLKDTANLNSITTNPAKVGSSKKYANSQIASNTPGASSVKWLGPDKVKQNTYDNGTAKTYSNNTVTTLGVTPRPVINDGAFASAVTPKQNQVINAPLKTATDSQAAVINKTAEPQIAQVQKSTGTDIEPLKQQVPPSKSITQLLQEENKNIIAKKQPAVKQDSKKVNFSVYAATYLNYATGSANQVNAGAGFTSDIKLGGNFKLSTGVALAQNTLRYDAGKPVAGGGSVAYLNTPSANVLRQDVNGFAVNSISQVSQNYNARLIGLDVPVNIKYEFNPQKNDTYISAGLSSGTFIDERYTQSFTYKSTNLSNAATTTQTQDDTETRNFNNFYFGKMLNVSFGVGYPLGKTNRLIIEPFLKYPLSGLGAQDLKFGAGGLNLKINFTSSKR